MTGEELRDLSDEALLRELLAFSRCRDAGRLAAALIDHFGGMAELSCATLREIRSIRGMDRRSALLLCLIGELSRRHPASCCLICEGGTDAVPAEPWSVYRAARGAGSRAVILAHSHPPSSPEPSAEDVERTGAMAAALGGAGVTLVDHIVIAGSIYFSLAESGFLPADDPLRQKYLEGIKK